MKINIFGALKILRAFEESLLLDLSLINFLDAETGTLGPLQPPFFIAIDVSDPASLRVVDQLLLLLRILEATSKQTIVNNSLITGIITVLNDKKFPASVLGNAIYIVFYQSFSTPELLFLQSNMAIDYSRDVIADQLIQKSKITQNGQVILDTTRIDERKVITNTVNTTTSIPIPLPQLSKRTDYGAVVVVMLIMMSFFLIILVLVLTNLKKERA